MSSFFKDIREIVDPKSVHTEEQIVALVEEKFTSTNKQSTPLCDCGEAATEHQCLCCYENSHLGQG